MMITTRIRSTCLACLFLLSLSGNAATPTISAGVSSTSILKRDGTVWGVGSVTNGGFGALQPTRLFPDITDGVAISAAGADYVLRTNGELWASGRNETGQLGDGTTVYRSTPYRVLDKVVQVDAQDSWAIALRTDGTVWTWGFNSSGQLGDRNRRALLQPAQVPGLSNIVAVAAGSSHGIALNADGTVFGWGLKGSIPNGDNTYYQPEDPRNFLPPTKIVGLPAVVSVRTGRYNTLFLDQAGQLWSYGGEWNGQLGNGTTSVPIEATPVKVSISSRVIAYSSCEHSLAITEDGRLWAWGKNDGGQLGMPSAGVVSLPTYVDLPAKAVSVSAGWFHSAVLLSNGQVFTFGDDTNAQLGRGLFQSSFTPAAMVAENSTGPFDVNTVLPVILGRPPGVSINNPAHPDEYNVRGTAPLTVTLEANAKVDSGRSVARYDWITSDGQTASGQRASFTFTQPGLVDVYAVATDSTGMRGADHRFVIPLPPNIEISVAPQIAAGPSATNALSSKGVLYGWGDPHYVGMQSNSTYGRGVVLPLDSALHGISKIALAFNNSLALTQAGQVLTWGFNCNGSLGNGSTIGWIDDPVRVPLPLPAIDVAAGGACHNAAVLADGSVWAWGGNEYGQLGQSDVGARSVPTKINGLSNITRIYLGQTTGYAVDSTGQLWGWGDNRFYQLGQDNNQVYRGPVRIRGLPAIRKVSAGTTFALAIAADGRVFGWGDWSGFLGDLSLASPVSTPTLVPALADFIDFSSSSFTLGKKADGSVWAWGSNWGGGLPGSTNPNEAAPIKVPKLSNPIAMAVTFYGGAVVLQDGTVASWGLNNWGQIGDGTYAKRQTPVLVVNETADDFLDLARETSNSIPRDLIPPFFVVTRANGNLNATTLSVDVKAPIVAGTFSTTSIRGKFAASYNVYVAASVPVIESSYFQLSSSNSWSALTWPMSAFMNGVALDSKDALVRTQILQNADLSSLFLAGTSIIVGYGTDPDEMVRSGRYRTIFTVPAQ